MRDDFRAVFFFVPRLPDTSSRYCFYDGAGTISTDRWFPSGSCTVLCI